MNMHTYSFTAVFNLKSQDILLLLPCRGGGAGGCCWSAFFMSRVGVQQPSDQTKISTLTPTPARPILTASNRNMMQAPPMMTAGGSWMAYQDREGRPCW